MPNRLHSALVALAVVSCAARASAATLDDVRRSVYKVRVTTQEANFVSPWLYKPLKARIGSGFYIGGGRILTNAHVVKNARFVTVMRGGDPQSRIAKVAAVADDADLALLTVEDRDAFTGVVPLALGDVPAVNSPVATVGYPLGGKKVSVTEGTVSRVDFGYYAHSVSDRHLLLQIDSAVNPGNSGGPVVQGGKAVGVAFQVNLTAQRTGYMIPTPIVRHFLRDLEDGRYDGHPELGVETMEAALMNEATARFHGLPWPASGVKVASVAPWSTAAGVLEPADVLLAIDGKPIGADGRVGLFGERVPFEAAYDLHQLGETVRFRLVRDARPLEVSLVLRKASPHYDQGDLSYTRPPYLTYGGLVFTALSRNFLQSWGSEWKRQAPLLLRYLHTKPDTDPWMREREEVVVLATRLPHAVNAYSAGLGGAVVTHVDGREVRSLRELGRRLRDARGDYVTIGTYSDPKAIVLPRKDAQLADAALRATYDMAEAARLAEPAGTLPIAKEGAEE